MRYVLCVAMLCALGATGCLQRSPATGECEVAGGVDCNQIAARLDRGDWMVNQQTKVWKVMISRADQNAPPRHAGYLIGKAYKQMRGGPKFQMYTVTSLNRNEQLGHIDPLGRAVRYEPRRNLGFEEVDVGTNTLTSNVAAILDTPEIVTLEPTSERRLAFEALDTNGDGTLTRDEVRVYGDRIANADSNGDGVVDFGEFQTIQKF